MFQLKFPESKITDWARRYDESTDELIGHEIAPRAKAAKCLSKEDFLAICEWKTPRSKTQCKRNADEDVREITRIALTASSEKVRLEILRLLHGSNTLLHRLFFTGSMRIPTQLSTFAQHGR